MTKLYPRLHRSSPVKLLMLVVVLILLWLPFLLVRLNVLGNMIIVGSYEFDLIALCFIAGLVLTVVVLIGMVFQTWTARRFDKVHSSEQQRQAAIHRDFLRRLDHEMKNPLTIIRVGLLNIQQTLLSDQQSS